MQEFPENAVIAKVIPKAKFYDRLDIGSAVKQHFVDDVERIVWRNKLTAGTLNVQPGERVIEIDVFEITLKGSELRDAVLKVIDNGIPHHILYLLRCGDKWQAAIGYKEIGKTAITLTVKEYYHTAWLSQEHLHILIIGMTLDEVFDNFVRQINASLPDVSGQSLRESLENQKQRERIQRQIDVLSKKMRAEKQPHKEFELFQQIKGLQRQQEVPLEGEQ